MTLTTTGLHAAADRCLFKLLRHAERTAQNCGLDVRDILVEVSRRGLVGGQENMIGDVALELLSVSTRNSDGCAAQRPVRTGRPAR